MSKRFTVQHIDNIRHYRNLSDNPKADWEPNGGSYEYADNPRSAVIEYCRQGDIENAMDDDYNSFNEDILVVRDENEDPFSQITFKVTRKNGKYEALIMKPFII